MAISNVSARPMVTALFPDRSSAELAYGDLSARGYRDDDINVMMSEDTRTRQFASTDHRPTELGSKAAESAGIGGAIGAGLGAIAAAIAALGTSVVVPGLGLVIAGPLAAALAGAGAGAASGGVLGALIGWGIPEERVKVYEEGIKRGGILLGVTPRSEEDARYFEGRFPGVAGVAPDLTSEVAAEVVLMKLEPVERGDEGLTQLRDRAWSATASTLAYVENEPLKALLLAAAGGALLMGLVALLARSSHD